MGRKLAIVGLSIFLFLVAGCGCSETDLGGETGVDGDAPFGDPTWDPPIENLGEPGWRESTEPWCEEVRGENPRSSNGFDVWSDERGVYALIVESACLPETCFSYDRIYFNGGTGWSLLFGLDGIPGTGVDPLEIRSIVGIPGGPLYGINFEGDLYAIEGSSWSYEPFRVKDIFVVSETLAYGTLRGDPRLVYYDGSSWGPYPGEPLPYQVSWVWADEESVFCAGESGTMLSLEAEGWLVHDTRTMESFSTIWGFSSADVWAGTYSGSLLHYDGTSWTQMEWPDMGDDSDLCHRNGWRIEGMWGTDDVLFMHTRNELVMWDGVGFTVLAYWPGEGADPDHCAGSITINSIWGNSENELFLAVYDEEHASRACGQEEYLLWYDGHEFHWF